MIQSSRPFKFKAINFLGGFFPSKPSLSEQYILDTALNSTGLKDWGSDSFLEGMRILIDSCKKEAKLHYIGREFLQKECLRVVKDRLRLEKAFKDNPDILNSRIEKPVFILGLPRTGTSLLQNLFFRDIRFRNLHYWEQIAVGPQPTPENLQNNYILDGCIKNVNEFRKMAPEFLSAHEIYPDGPEECNGLMARNFSNILYFMFRNIPTYMEWFKNKDMTTTYEYHKQQLKFLGYNFKGMRWVLKAPVHLLFLKYLFKVYPDAYIIQMHRDPLEVVPSMASLSSISRGIHSNEVNEMETAQQFLELTAHNINQSILYRQNREKNRILDISYTELVNNKIGTMKNIYTWLGVDFKSNTEKIMSNWLEKNKLKRKRNSHQYSLEQFNLSKDQIRDRFDNYYEIYSDYL
jgi:hypothetical protein